MLRTEYHTEPTFVRHGTVYPGHPVVIAAYIMHYYQDDIDSAFEPCRKGNGWPNAAGDERIPGAGDAIYAGLELIRIIRDKRATIEEVFEFGIKRWTLMRNASSSAFKDRVIPGNLEACVYGTAFKTYAEKLLK